MVKIKKETANTWEYKVANYTNIANFMFVKNSNTKAAVQMSSSITSNSAAQHGQTKSIHKNHNNVWNN